MSIKFPVVPASFFGIVIGLAGLGTAWRWAHQVWGLPAVVGEAIIWLSIAVWAGLTILYIAKWFVARDDASAEVADAVQCCFVGLIGVATMLVAGGIQPYSPALAVILFTAGDGSKIAKTRALLEMLKFQEEREAVTDQRPAYVHDFGNLRIGDKKFRPPSRNAIPNTIGEVQRDVRCILA